MGDPVRKCEYCGKALVEVGRNEAHVFYVCGCKNFNRKICNYDYMSAIVQGVEYQIDPKSCAIVHVCPTCGSRCYRLELSNEKCIKCGAVVIARKMSDNIRFDSMREL